MRSRLSIRCPRRDYALANRKEETLNRVLFDLIDDRRSKIFDHTYHRDSPGSVVKLARPNVAYIDLKLFQNFYHYKQAQTAVRP